MTVRKSLDRMVADGLLFRRAGKGSYVAPRRSSTSQAESFSGSMREHGRTSTTRVLSAGITRPPGRLGEILGEPVAIHQSHLPIEWAQALESDLTGSLTQALDDLGGHVANVNDRIEALPAVGDDASLLGVAPGAPLLKISGVATEAGGTVLRYSEALYRGDRVSLTVNSPHASTPDIALMS